MRKIVGMLANITRVTSLGALLIMVFVVVLQVTARYVFRRPVGWTEEIALATMIWITFFGSFLAFVEKKHMRISLLYTVLKPSLQRTVLVIGDFLVIVLNVYVIHYGLLFAEAFRNLSSPYLGIPMYYQYMIIPIAATLWIIYMIFEILEVLRNSDYWYYLEEAGGPVDISRNTPDLEENE